MFDANQLYHSAEAGQIGARRTVAVTILRPLAALSNALRISGPVNAADSALGRCGIGGAPVCGSGGNTVPTIPVTIPSTVPVTIPPPVVVVDRRSTGYLGLFGAPHLGGAPVPRPLPSWPPQIASPTGRRPLTLLSIGDSIGEDLGYGLGDVFSTDSAVRVVQEGVEDTGLSRADYYNWPATLEVELQRYHPKIVVVMMGANDAQAFYDGNNTWLSFGRPSSDPSWWRAYTARVALIMDEATDAGAHVMWVGLPPDGFRLDGTGLVPEPTEQGLRLPGAHPSRRELLLGRQGSLQQAGWLHRVHDDRRLGASRSVPPTACTCSRLATTCWQETSSSRWSRAWHVNLGVS